MKHPSVDKLALYSGNDLNVLDRWTVGRHVHSCEQCRQEIELFRESSREATVEYEALPASVQWDRLAGEMRANIRLGLEASDAIKAYSPPVPGIASGPGWNWRMVAMAAGIAMIASVGYWFGALRQNDQIAILRGPAPVIVEASERGVGLSSGDKGMELQAPGPGKRAALVSVSTTGAAGARYVDEETGQVTVNSVYVD